MCQYVGRISEEDEIEDPASINEVDDEVADAQNEDLALEKMWHCLYRQIPAGLVHRDMSAQDIRELLNIKPAWLQRVTVCDISDQQLTTLSPEIGYFTALEELNLNRNRLTILPPEINRLTSLKTLRLKDNRLVIFPHEITQLTSLETLDLSNNRLAKIDDDMTPLMSLETIRISGNPFNTYPPEIGTLRYLQKMARHILI